MLRATQAALLEMRQYYAMVRRLLNRRLSVQRVCGTVASEFYCEVFEKVPPPLGTTCNRLLNMLLSQCEIPQATTGLVNATVECTRRLLLDTDKKMYLYNDMLQLIASNMEQFDYVAAPRCSSMFVNTSTDSTQRQGMVARRHPQVAFQLERIAAIVFGPMKGSHHSVRLEPLDQQNIRFREPAHSQPAIVVLPAISPTDHHTDRSKAAPLSMNRSAGSAGSAGHKSPHKAGLQCNQVLNKFPPIR